MATINENRDELNQVFSHPGKSNVNHWKTLGNIPGECLAISFRWKGFKHNSSLQMLTKQALIPAHLEFQDTKRVKFVVPKDEINSKELTCQCRRPKRCKFDASVRKIPWRRKWQPTPVFLSGESHGQKSLAGYSPWGRKESDTPEAT